MIARALLLAAVVAAPLAGQEPPEEGGKSWIAPVARWGKFGAVGVAAGLFTVAAVVHRHADERFDQLLDRCRTDPSQCTRRPDGRYTDPASERLFQEALDQDRRARHWLLGGQAALVASAVLWIVDLTQGGGRPENIPFVPLTVERRGNATLLSLNFRF